jgi:hypothetical protein
MIATAILTVLLADPGVSAIVGTRGYALLLPQGIFGTGARPAFRVQVISQINAYPLDIGATNFFKARVQVDAYARDDGGGLLAAERLADAIEAAIGGKRFTDGSSPAEVDVQGCFLLVRTQSYDPDELRLVCLRQDYDVVFRAL